MKKPIHSVGRPPKFAAFQATGVGSRALGVRERSSILVPDEFGLSADKLQYRSAAADLTGDFQREGALHLLGEITANAPQGIALYRAASGTIHYANRRFEALFGYDPGELIGKHASILNASTQESPQEVAEKIIRSINRYGVWSGEVLNRKKDGTEFWTFANVSTFQHPELGALWVTHQSDITERKRLESEIAEFHRNIEIGLDNTTDMIYFKDRAGRIQFCSQSLARTAGYASWRDLIGKVDLEVFPAEIAWIFYENEHSVIAEGKPLLNKIDPYLDREGRSRYVQTNKLPIFDQHGTVSGVFSISRDVTEHQELHDALERQVRERTEQLRAMAMDLTATEERERRVIARELHDGLGQSLAVAKLKLSALTPPCEVCSWYESLKRQVDEIGALIDEANGAVRSLSLQLCPPMLYELGLVPALEWLAEEMQRAYGLRVNVRHEGRSRHLDEALLNPLFRITRELLINVARHAQVDEAELAAMWMDDSLVLGVTDCGIGFDPGTRQAPSSSGGYGLFGLRERIDFFGGNVQIDSSPGDGTVVVLTVPLAAHRRGQAK